MPTKILEITDAPVNLLTALDVDGIPLGLVVGQQYTGDIQPSGHKVS